MHPPPFRADHRLSDWPDCRLEARCPKCGRSAFIPVQLLIHRHGDRRIHTILRVLCCPTCGTRPAPVFLLAGDHRTHCGGTPPDWAVEMMGGGSGSLNCNMLALKTFDGH